MKNRYAFVLLMLLFASTLSVAQVTVKFQKPASWTAVSLYTWGPELLGGWPGATLTETDGWYTYTFDATFTGANLIFNNNGSPQTVNYPATAADVCLEAASAANSGGEFPVTVVPCSAPGITVTFKKPASWTNVNLYAYVNNAPIIGSWPGAALTETNGVYTFTFDAAYTSINVIYNNGTAQLDDINITSSTCFQANDGEAIAIVDCSTITSVNNVKEKSLVFFPNPIVDKLNFMSSSKINRVSVYSITGKCILTDIQLSENGVLDVKSLKPGVYFVSVYFADGKQQFEKIVKQ